MASDTKIEWTQMTWNPVTGLTKISQLDVEYLDERECECRQARIQFLFKQWCGMRKDLTGHELNGRTYDEMPIRKVRDAIVLSQVNY